MQIWCFLVLIFIEGWNLPTPTSLEDWVWICHCKACVYFEIPVKKNDFMEEKYNATISLCPQPRPGGGEHQVPGDVRGGGRAQ